MRRVALALVPVLLAAGGLVACTQARTLNVVASWTTGDDDESDVDSGDAERRSGSEAGPFLAVLKAFTKKTGIKVIYQGTRDVSQVLRSGVDRGRPPDVAVLPRLNDLQTYVQSGDLRALDDVLDPQERADLAPQLLPLQGPRDERPRVYGLSVGAHAKSLVWYVPGVPGGPTAQNPPATWAELVGLTRDIQARGGVPWCLGMGAQPVSGWPGTDWIEDILLHQSGPAFYESWAAGQEAWTSARVRAAWKAWGELVAAGRRTDNALLTTFDAAGLGMFTAPPRCHLDHQASFIVRSYQSQDPPRGFDFFPFPSAGPAAADPVREIAEDVMGMFRDTPEARELIRYLAGDPARAVWQEASGHLAFTLNAGTDPTAYPDGLPRRIARTLTTGTRCRDASDMMPATMTAAFQSAALQFLDDPALLDRLLTELDTVRGRTPKDQWMRLSCLSA
ncbi:Bacterial extracellular solute-binding protein [Micromonospora sp. MW-13]|uniref:ABC transporter substrate-binding protein n=1 Tax=Micromonospora sp. MW-13 TaxID=2094022 RepID=UPI000E43F293|nr:ABC transporter substrate-binding protein [Micromonospora sp. MW-13]RGC69119.1 Bacterial extracellular solute-binding protein [Micromonospora sp. MW-13]